MQDNWFWRGVACVALVAALGYVVSRLAEAPAAHAQTGETIAVCGNENNQHILYIVDTSKKVILMYGSGSTSGGFRLLASRYYDVDAQATVGKEFPYTTRGYSINDMRRHAP